MTTDPEAAAPGQRPDGAAIGRTVQQHQASVDDFDREMARLLGVNETDLRCLELLLQDEPEAAPSALGARLGLTSGSVTIMLDRLEAIGYLTRSPHPTDGRKVLVRATAEAARRAYELITPLIDEGARELLARYTPEQLELITDFLRRDTDLHARHVQRLRALPTPPPSGRSARERR